MRQRAAVQRAAKADSLSDHDKADLQPMQTASGQIEIEVRQEVQAGRQKRFYNSDDPAKSRPAS